MKKINKEKLILKELLKNFDISKYRGELMAFKPIGKEKINASTSPAHKQSNVR